VSLFMTSQTHHQSIESVIMDSSKILSELRRMGNHQIVERQNLTAPLLNIRTSNAWMMLVAENSAEIQDLLMRIILVDLFIRRSWPRQTPPLPQNIALILGMGVGLSTCN
jgi:hypothetical protein